MAGRPPGLAPLGLNVSNSSLRTSMSTDLGASYNLTDEGIRLLSASAREFKLTSAGLKTTTRGDDASTPPPRTSPTDAPPRTSTSLTSSVLAREAWSRRRSTSPPTASSPSR